MAYLNVCGFETGDASELVALAGTGSIQSSIKRTGSYALRCNPTTGVTTGYGLIWGLAATGESAPWAVAGPLYITFYLYLGALPSAEETIFTAVNNGTSGDTEVKIHLTASGVLKAYRYNPFSGPTWTLIATGTTTLTTGVWYRLDVKSSYGTDAPYELKLDGATEFSGTQTMGGTAMQSVVFGKSYDYNSGSIDCYYDDIAISDSAYPGEGEVRILKPNGAGNYTAWTGTYTDVDEVPHDDDTTYLASSTSTQAETVALDSATTGGVSGTIGTVKACAIVRDEGGTSSINLRTRSGTTDDDTSGVNLADSYNLLAKLYDTDPADAGAWTSGDLDGLEVGVLNNNAVAVRCTALYAMVWCTGQINTTVTPGAASLTTTRYSPSAKVNNIATPGALSLTTTRYTPSAILNNIATPGALSAALTAYAPAATVGLAVTPGTLATALTAYAPTVINPQSATPGTLALATTRYTPTALLNSIATPGALSAALTAYTPTVTVGLAVAPGALAAALTAYTPTVMNPQSATPGAGVMALTAYAPGVVLGTKATPGALSAALTAYAPGVVLGTKVTPGAGAMALTAYGPSVLTPVVVTPATLSAVLTAHAPGAPIGTKVTPGALSAALTAYGLAVNIGWQLTPGPASLAVMTYGLSWTLSGFPNPDRRLYGAGRFAAGGYGSGRFGSINRGTGRSDQPGRGAGR